MIASQAESQLNRLGAELAARRSRRNVPEALRAGLHLRRFSRGRIELLQQILRRQHQEEIHHRGNQEEVDNGRKKRPILDLTAVHMRDHGVEVRLTHHRTQQRIDNVRGQCGNDRSEGCADNHGDGQIHHVAAQDEIAKSLKHGTSSLLKTVDLIARRVYPRLTQHRKPPRPQILSPKYS